jgi:hypothetical protein
VKTVTRIEIADFVEDAFGPGGAHRSALLATATERGAAPVVLTKLGELPDRHFRSMRDLWDHIPEVPLD